MGVLIGSAVVPIACCLSWSKCTATAAISGAWGGLAASLTAWLVYTKCVYGSISLENTGKVSENPVDDWSPYNHMHATWWCTSAQVPRRMGPKCMQESCGDLA